MNTAPVSPSPPEHGIGDLLVTPVTPEDEQIGALQKEIEGLKNQHAEDKFLWFLCATALFDVAALLSVESWTGPVIIGVIELIAVVVMADRCKVDLVAPLIDKLTGAFSRSKS